MKQDPFCPMCGIRKLRKGRRISVDIPPDAEEAEWTGTGEVTKRGKPKNKEDGGKFQILHIWEGDYYTNTPPFCSSACAARYGVICHRDGLIPKSVSDKIPKWRQTAQKSIDDSTDTADDAA